MPPLIILWLCALGTDIHLCHRIWTNYAAVYHNNIQYCYLHPDIWEWCKMGGAFMRVIGTRWEVRSTCNWVCRGTFTCSSASVAVSVNVWRIFNHRYYKHGLEMPIYLSLAVGQSVFLWWANSHCALFLVPLYTWRNGRSILCSL